MVNHLINQIDSFKEQLKREPFPLPTVKINPDVKDIFSFKMSDFTLENYQHHEAIKYNVAV